MCLIRVGAKLCRDTGPPGPNLVTPALNSQIDRWPPGRNSSETTKIKSLMDRYGLVLGGKTFFWYTKNLKNFSRINYWLVSKDLNKEDISISTHPTLLTDHKAILATVEQSFCKNWELFKYKCAKFLRSYGSMCVRARRVEEDNIISHISSIREGHR